MVWSPVLSSPTTLHSRFTTPSLMRGGFTYLEGNGVNPVSVNLSTSLPEWAPQYKTSSSTSILGKTRTNSPPSWISLWLYRVTPIDITAMGGLLEVGMFHPKVMMLGLPAPSIETARTVLSGYFLSQASFAVTSCNVLTSLDSLVCLDVFIFSRVLSRQSYGGCSDIQGYCRRRHFLRVVQNLLNHVNSDSLAEKRVERT